MNSNAGVATTSINGETVVLIFNEDVIMFNRDCRLVVAFPDNTINGWNIKFIYVDSEFGNRPFSSQTTYEDGGKTIVITYYSWYGSGVETDKPHYIEAVSGNTKIYIKTRTSALKNIDTRKIHVSIWKVHS